MPREFSLAYLTLPGIDPLEQIRIAGGTGYDCVSLRTIPMGQPGEPQNILEADSQLFERIRQEMECCHVRLLDIELVRIREDLPADYRPAFEKGALLGAKHVLSSVWTKDFDFAAERYAAICDQAAEFDLDVNMEFPIVSAMTTFRETVAMQKRVGKPNLKVFVDTLYAHFNQMTPEDFASISPDSYGIIHLCDCPKDTAGDITSIVRAGREYCGLGQADLPMMLRAMPRHPCSIELPNLKNIAQYGPEGHARRCLETAKALFTTHRL